MCMCVCVCVPLPKIVNAGAGSIDERKNKIFQVTLFNLSSSIELNNFTTSS